MLAHILVVDDDPAIVEVLNRFLRRQGYEVSTAFSQQLSCSRDSLCLNPDAFALGRTRLAG